MICNGSVLNSRLKAEVAEKLCRASASIPLDIHAWRPGAQLLAVAKH
jgi:hypothetical protein